MNLEIFITDKPEFVEGKTFLRFVGRAVDGKCYSGWICKDELDTGMS